MQVSPFSGVQFCPIRHPPALLKSTHLIGRQSCSVMHFFREMVHSPALQDSCAQSTSTWQLQKPKVAPSRSRHTPEQNPVAPPPDFMHVPPRLQSLSSVQDRAGSGGQGRLGPHCQREKTTMMSRQP